MKVGTICYLPPWNVGYPRVFLQHLLSFTHRHPLVFYTDSIDQWRQVPGIISLTNQVVKGTGRFWWRIATRSFFEAVHIAQQNGWDYFLFIETDCRFAGNDWDGRIFDEALTNPELLVASTFFGSNVYNETFTWIREYELWRSRHPMPVSHPSVMLYGSVGAVNHAEANIWPNGALSVLHTETMARFFPYQDIGEVPRTAYDVIIGQRLRAEYGPSMFSKMHPMQCAFSYYGDLLFTEQFRLDLLKKDCVAVHAVKSNKVP